MVETGNIKNGLKWNGISQIVTQSSIIIGSVTLSRILSPEDFGTVAMVTIISTFAAMFLDMGFSQALIQKKDVSDRELSSVFWLNNSIGLVFFLTFLLGAPVIAVFYKIPQLESLTQVISITFLLSALPQIPRVILSRKMDFKKMGIVNIIAIPISYLAAIILAKNHFGLWSIVAQILISNVLIVSTFWLSIKWRPKVHFSQKDLSSIMNFSINTFFNQFLEYWAQNVSGLLLGKNVGATDMGIYNRSRVFILLPVNNISMVINKTVFPKMAQLQNEPEKVKELYIKMARFQAFWIMPAMVGLSFVSQEFVLFFLGDQWTNMIPILQIFAFLSIISSTFALNDTTISSQGRADLLLKLGFFEKGIFILFSIIGVQYGLMGVVYANTIGALIIFVPKYLLLKKVIKIGFKDHLENYWSIILKCGLMYLGLYEVNLVLNISDYGILLGINTFIGTLIYILLNLILKDPIFEEMLLKIKLKK